MFLKWSLQCVAGLCLLLLLTSPSEAVNPLELATRTATTVLTTDMNSLANNAWTIASGVIDNRIGQGVGEGYLLCGVELFAVFNANPTAGGAITGFFLQTIDGTNYEVTPTASIAQTRLPNFVIPVVTGQTTTRTTVWVRCPPERFKVAIQNTATGQAMAASGNTLKILWATPQGN
jgi:hypothetical protein